MELTSREALAISYALISLALNDSEEINASKTELLDLSTKVLGTQYKADKAATDYGFGTFPAH